VLAATPYFFGAQRPVGQQRPSTPLHVSSSAFPEASAPLCLATHASHQTILVRRIHL
jgi:hypothetical protein